MSNRTPHKIIKDCGIDADRLQKEKPMLYANIRRAMDEFAEQYANWKLSKANKENKSTEQVSHIDRISSDFDPNGTKEKIITSILYRYMCEVDGCVNEIDFEDVVRDIIKHT
jgi:hypothetical protein